MSLDTVVEDIRDEARRRAEEIRAAADERSDEIIGAAQADAEEIRAEVEAETDDLIDQEHEQRLSSAKLEAKQERLAARRDILEDVREAAAEGVASLSGDEREALTRELLEAAAEEFDADDEIRVYGRADDEELISGLLTDFDGYEYAGEYDCLGGVVVESQASRVRVNNTFDSILETVWEDRLQDITSRLFEAQ
jgi:V/A-type H+-transporting ATPase subunit E